jgi:tetratricopeptide (TPR) repeat protein
MHDALAAEDFARVAALYAGPFLDGFDLAGAPEFERWADTERARWRSAAFRALESLARTATERNAPLDALAWWRRLADLDPLSSRYATGVVRSLADSGETAAALAAARAFEDRVRTELDAQSDDTLRDLVESIRARRAATAAAEPATTASTERDVTPLPELVRRPAPMGLRRHRYALATAHATARATVLAGSVAIAILAWRLKASSPTPTDARPTPAVGATRTTDSTIAPMPRRPAGVVRTSSPAAYALYEEGLRAYYENDISATYRLMSAALDRDSTFAMAAYHAWVASRMLQREPEATRLLPVVKRLASRTVDRERLLIQGTLAIEEASVAEYLAIARELTTRFPDDPDGHLLLGSARFAAGDWRGSIAAWNRVVAIDSAVSATSQPICHACTALRGMSAAYLWWDSTAAAERAARRILAFRPTDGLSWGGLAESLMRLGRRDEAEAAIARAKELSHAAGDFTPALDRDLIRGGRLAELDAKLRADLGSATPGVRTDAAWLLGISLRNQGRFGEARQLAEHRTLPGLPRRIDDRVDDVTLAVVDLETGAPLDAAQRFLRMATDDRRRGGPAGQVARQMAWHLTLAGTALAAAGDTLRVRALADSVERIGAGSSFGRDARLHHFLRGLLLQRVGRHAEAVEAFRRSLFSPTEGYTRINLEMARSLLVLGREREAVTILQPALRGGVDGSNTYVTHTELHEALAHAFDQGKRPACAAAHSAAVERAWRSADPLLAHRYRLARAMSRANSPP